MYREHTKVVQIGDRKIGGGNPILIQSMTNTKTDDVEATVKQISGAGGRRLRDDPLRSAGYGGSRSAFRNQKTRSTFLLWQIFILITVLPLQLWKTERTRSALILEILEAENGSRQLWMWQKKEIFLSV